MNKVSYFWRLFALFLVGFALGLFVSFKYVQRSTPAGQMVEIGKIKITGTGHQVTTDIELKEDPAGEKKKSRR